jgi:hypothetical protein
VVEDFDFEKLSGSNEVASNFNVRFRRSWFATYADSGISGVIPHPVLCRMACDLPWFSWVRHSLDTA